MGTLTFFFEIKMFQGRSYLRKECRQLCKFFSSTSTPPRTGIVMMNMGGPKTVPDVGPFLTRLFEDPEIITLGRFQNTVGPMIARRRTPKVEEQYAQIGGSPILKWTNIQGERMVELLDTMSPETGPHKHYVMFRYADPLTEETLLQMKADGIKRAVAFSQYPQFSCTTTGSSLNHLWREQERLGLTGEFEWSLIDRWPIHPTFIEAVTTNIQTALADVPEDIKDETVIIFSAHSLPMKVVHRGDQYPQEVAATVQSVMQKLNFSNPYILCWQSKVGPLPWLGPQTDDVLKGFGRQSIKSVLMVPIAFTSDHVETLYEIDIEYKEDAEKAGIEHFWRAPSLNGMELISQAQAELVQEHLASGEVCSEQYKINCAGCVNPMCRSIVNPIKKYENIRTMVKAKAEAAKSEATM